MQLPTNSSWNKCFTVTARLHICPSVITPSHPYHTDPLMTVPWPACLHLHCINKWTRDNLLLGTSSNLWTHSSNSCLIFIFTRDLNDQETSEKNQTKNAYFCQSAEVSVYLFLTVNKNNTHMNVFTFILLSVTICMVHWKHLSDLIWGKKMEVEA